MLKFLSTYRSFLFGLLIISYVFSVFQKPLFETLHFMCHVPSIIFSQGKVHSYNSHAKELHAHENLAAFYNASDENDNLPLSQNEEETKKKIEINDQYFSTSTCKMLCSKKQLPFNLLFQTTFIKIPNPPPRLG